ncbi:MAG TPA: sigma 54-interacting transcriptional regulator [Negativicutes bacterium]|nr:sigma 54-interacting transcriptional regulator [Negativicutes bacterium]
MKKRIGIITMNIETADFYKELLDSLFGDFAEVIPYSIEDRSVYAMLPCDLYLLSSTSYDLGRNADLLNLIPKEALIVKSRPTFTKEAINKLSGFKKGTKALLANQSQHMALESISQLYHLGISNIEFQPFYPELGEVQEAELVVAPGELAGKQADSILPDIRLELCCNAKTSFDPRLVKIKGMNINLTLTPLHVREQYLGACAMVQKFEDGESKQNNLRLQMMERAYRAKYTFDDIVGESPTLRRACDIARRMAGNDASVILEGDSGTGKEMFAQAIHNASSRRNHPFIAINCAALPETLLESELFVYEDGAFTGARKGGKVACLSLPA